MREIKFKAKVIEPKNGVVLATSAPVGTWVFGDLHLFHRVPHIHHNGAGRSAIDIDTICQFTGLTDKNGQEIYEGDIVECVSWNEYFSKGGQLMEAFRRKMYVDFRKGAFVMVEPMPEPLSDNEWPIIYDGDVIVIGNIHDNPELINDKSV